MGHLCPAPSEAGYQVCMSASLQPVPDVFPANDALAALVAWPNGSQLKSPDVSQFAGYVQAREAALVGGGSFGVVAMADGEAAGQEGHRLGGTTVVLQRAEERIGVIDDDVCDPADAAAAP